MQIKLFSIPIGADDTATEEMNHFLRANKIIDIKKELALLDGNSCWTFCVTYMLSTRPLDVESVRQKSSNKVDYKEVLAPEAFERFSLFRKIRKQIADSEAIPAYAVFTDAELAELAKLPELTIVAIQKIPGIGKKKIEKYASMFVTNQSNQADEAHGTFDGKHSEP